MRRWLPAAFIAGAVIFSVAVYSRLPEEVPLHWGISGDPDRFGPRLQGAFMMPLVMIMVYLGMQWYPSRDPRAVNIAKFRDVYDTVVTASIAMLGDVHVVALGTALGWRFDMRTVVLTWRFRNARPVRLSYSPLRALDGGVLMETIELAFDGVEMA